MVRSPINHRVIYNQLQRGAGFRRYPALPPNNQEVSPPHRARSPTPTRRDSSPEQASPSRRQVSPELRSPPRRRHRAMVEESVDSWRPSDLPSTAHRSRREVFERDDAATAQSSEEVAPRRKVKVASVRPSSRQSNNEEVRDDVRDA